MKNLISMTDFVLEQNKREEVCREDFIKCSRYANFLKQPLELWMFVPCKLIDGVWVVLEKPRHYDEWESEFKKGFEHLYEGLIMKKYHQAKERCLFKGFEFTTETEDDYHLKEDGIYMLTISKDKKETIESIINQNFKLTPTVKKQIGL